MSPSPSRNPYIVGGWVDGPHFYGYIGLRYNLLSDPNRQLWVVGTRRVGKTSLLRQLIRDAGPEFVSLYWDMQACETAADLDQELLYAIEERTEALQALGLDPDTLADNDVRRLLNKICRAAADRGKYILLLIDEPEALLAIGQKEDILLRRLRSIFQRHANLRVILTSTKAFARINELTRHWETSPFLQDFAPRNLSGFDPIESEALIRQSQNAQRVQATAEVVAAVQHHTNHHPYLIQWLCYRLFQDDGSLRAPRADDLCPDANLEALFEISYKHLSLTERRILHHAASTGPTDEAGLIQALGLSHSDIHLYLYALSRMGYTRLVSGNILIGNSFLEHWLKANLRNLPIEDAEIADAWVREVATTGQQAEKIYLQQQLQTIRINLARLEVKAANYGLDVPLHLQNEIDFHLGKIKELEGRLDGLAEDLPAKARRPEP